MLYHKIKPYIYSAVVLLFVILGGSSVPAHASEITQEVKLWDTFTYDYQNQILEFTIYKLPQDSTMGEVNILGPKDKTSLIGKLILPDTVTYNGDTYLVKSIGLKAFADCDNITSVDIPYGITSINQQAFYSCDSLADVTMADSVISIGSNVFTSDKMLTNIKLSKNLTKIPFSSFSGCTSLESIEIPDGVTKIEQYAFQNCGQLQNIRIPETVTSIDREAFDNYNTIFSVVRGSYAASFCKSFAYSANYYSDALDSSIPLDDITIRNKFINLSSGETTSLTLLYYPNNTTDTKDVVWSSNHPDIVSISPEGKVTAKRSGIAYVTATIGNKVATCMITVRLEAAQKVKAVSAGIDRIHISWAAVPGTNSYRISRSNSKYGDFKVVGYSFKPYYDDLSIAPYTTYYYKIYASGSGSTSRGSKVVSARSELGVPVLSAASKSNHSIGLVWNTIKEASGYDIYRSTSKSGNFHFYKSVKNCNDFIDTSLSQGKNYYYYMKAYYYNKNSKKVFSTSSNTVHTEAKTPPSPKYVTLGTSISDVYKILGRPDRRYFSTDVDALLLDYMRDQFNIKTEIILEKEFNTYIVTGWYFEGTNSKISDGNGNHKDYGTFTLGSSFEDVIKAMPTPNYLHMTYKDDTNSFDFKYHVGSIKYSDGSTISFDENVKVTGWSNKGSLKVRYGSVKPTKAVISLGTPLKDVLNALGTPNSLDTYFNGLPEQLSYGKTKLYFDRFQQLRGWTKKGKLNISLGDKVSSAPNIQIGSTYQEVIQAMGTPDSLVLDETSLNKIECLTYPKATFYFDFNLRVSRIV